MQRVAGKGGGVTVCTALSARASHFVRRSSIFAKNSHSLVRFLHGSVRACAVLQSSPIEKRVRSADTRSPQTVNSCKLLLYFNIGLLFFAPCI